MPDVSARTISNGQSTLDPRSHAGRPWAGYAAAACAFLFALVSLYWGVGGRFGLDTVGREAVRLSREGNLGAYLALWFVSLLKIGGGLLALALVQPWGARLLPRWMLLLAGWGGAALLVLYGTGQIGIQLLVVTGVVDAPADMDWRGFHGHLYLWDPWFLVWGVLLGLAAWSFTRSTRAPTRHR